jgi:hypothetical protein
VNSLYRQSGEERAVWGEESSVGESFCVFSREMENTVGSRVGEEARTLLFKLLPDK